MVTVVTAAAAAAAAAAAGRMNRTATAVSAQFKRNLDPPLTPWTRRRQANRGPPGPHRDTPPTPHEKLQ